ncbi:MAG: hypothetical protein GF372_02325 [Candidatus Marinimicrobia bacterium]|nr:hypothetical protein [Candidatus Neomarinimicrobiota bacterium]
MYRSVLKYCLSLSTFLIVMCLLPYNLFAPPLPDDLSKREDAIYNDLVNRLVQDGHDPDYIKYLYGSGNDVFYYRLTKINLIQRESRDIYRRMFNDEAKRDIRAFLVKHENQFAKMEHKYGVDRETIAAILYVETRFGRVTGNHPVVYVLSSMTLAPADWNIEQLVEELDELFPELTESERVEKVQWLKRRAQRKSSWAYRELNTLLKLDKSHNLNASDLKGSWAGAFGMPQFMPTSFEAYAVDGNGDDIIDITGADDAIASVANYLYRNGWRGTMTRQKKRKAIWRYNHSNHYVDLIEDLANATTVN